MLRSDRHHTGPRPQPKAALAEASRRWLAWALTLALAPWAWACGSTSPAPGGGGGGAGGGSATFAPNPAVCPPDAGVRSGMRVRELPGGAVSLDAAAEALAVAGYTGVTRTDDLGLADAVAAVDERGDVVVVTAAGALGLVSSCALDGLGQVHRLDDGLARLAQATASLSGVNLAAATRGWVLPAGIFGANGTYWRQAAGAGLDLNAPTTGTLALTADAQLGFVLAGSSDPASQAGDVVGVQSLALDDDPVLVDDKRTVQGPVSLRWELPTMAQGSRAIDLHLVVTDASLRWQVGVWIPYVEAWFPAPAQGEPAGEVPSLALTLQGALPGAIRKAQPIAALGLPAALTQVRSR